MSRTVPSRGRPAPRGGSGALVLLFTVACGVTIAATRAYLALTGYPQIGNGVFHIAHALWGGLLLTVAVVVAVVLVNPWAPAAAALLGGIGAGLFVDEIGKFITQKNDYFFPLAATIVYLFLVLMAACAMAIDRWSARSVNARLHAVLDVFGNVAEGRELTGPQQRRARRHLDALDVDALRPAQRQLAIALRQAVDEAPVRSAGPSLAERCMARLGERGLRRIARTLLALQALAGILTLVVIPLAPAVGIDLIPGEVGSIPVGGLATAMTLVSMVCTIAAGVLCAVAFVAMRPGAASPERALRFGLAAIVLLLLGSNTLGAYTSQFTVLADATGQLAAGGSLALWARTVRAGTGSAGAS